MERLRAEHDLLINRTRMNFRRYLTEQIPWNNRLIAIKGFRGTGKTTMLLQYIKMTYGLSEEAIYISLDNLFFANNTLSEFVDDFVNKGGKHIFIDEVHKYQDWAIEIKNIYDRYHDLKVVFTGSSLLEILNSRADLSRRALSFNLQGLSFREYLNFITNSHFKPFELSDILISHKEKASEISDKIKPLKYLSSYLQYGYYPFFIEDIDYYHHRLNEIINMIIEIEMPLLRNIDFSKTTKVKQLLYIIAQSSPFKPNISKLSERIGITRNTLVEYIKILNDTELLNTIYKNAFGINLLQKPDKIYLENTNLAFMLAGANINTGNNRETFFLNQLKNSHKINYPDKGDFMVNNKFIFEVGGKNKTSKQISGLTNAFIVSDDIEVGYSNTIPLWLFGFLY